MKLCVILWFIFMIAFCVSAQVPPYQHTPLTTNAATGAPSDGLVPVYNGSDSTWHFGTPTASVGAFRPLLTNSLTYFVATTGNDSNPGTNAGSPLLTVQAAVNKAMTWDFSTNNVTIQIADGTYAGSILAAQQVGTADWKEKFGQIILHGNDSSPTSVVITNASTNHLIMASMGTHLLVESLTVGSTARANINLLDSQLYSTLGISNVVIGPCGSSSAQIVCESQSHFFTFGSNQVTAGNSLVHLLCIGNSSAWIVNTNGVFNNPTFTVAFVQAYGGGSIFISGGGYVGSATCPKYNLLAAGSIVTFEGTTPEASLAGNSAGQQDLRSAEDTSQPAYLGTNGIAGVTDGGTAATGVVGEIVSALVPFNTATNLLNNTPTNLMSISLTAGDWDVEGSASFDFTSATVTKCRAGISTTANTVPADGTAVFSGIQLTTTTTSDSLTVPRKRISVNTTTTVFLTANNTFSAGTVTGYGQLSARRVR